MSNIRENIFNYFEEREVENVPILEPDALDMAILGVTENQIVYSYDKLIEAYTIEFREDNMSDDELYEQAIEWVEYNTLRSIPYMGDNKPIIVYSIDDI